MSAKLNKRDKIPSVNAVRSVLLFASLMVLIAACNSKSKIATSDKKALSLSEEVASLQKQIALDNYMGTERIARQQHVDSAYLRKQELMRIATDEELKTLANDQNAIVGLTAFQGLYNRGNLVIPSIFDNYINRSDRIQFVRGDLLVEMSMLEYAYVYIMNYEIPNEVFPGEDPYGEPKFKLSEEDQRKTVRMIHFLRGRD